MSGKAVGAAESVEQIEVAFPAVAEATVLAHDDVDGVQGVEEHGAHEVLGRERGEDFAEGQDQDVVCSVSCRRANRIR